MTNYELRIQKTAAIKVPFQISGGIFLFISSFVIRNLQGGVLAEFLHVINADQFIRLLGSFARLSSRQVPLDESLHRVLSEDVTAPEDLPEGSRSTVDGFAVCASPGRQMPGQ